MKWGALLIITAILCLVVASSAANAETKLTISIPSDKPQQAVCQASHAFDLKFDNGGYDRTVTYAAIYDNSVDYAIAGPNDLNSWLAYFWSGTQEKRTNFDLIFTSFDNSGSSIRWDVDLFDHANGPKLFRFSLGANDSWATNLATYPVSKNSRHTQGYRGEIALVPEPTGFCVVMLGIVGVFGQIVNSRRR